MTVSRSFLLGLLWILGCGNPQAQLRFAQVASKTVDGPTIENEAAGKRSTPEATESEAKPPAQAACELRLYIHQEPGEGAYGIDSGELGAAVVERQEGRFVDGVCIKRAGMPLELPASAIIAGTDESMMNRRFCREPSKQAKLIYGDSPAIYQCPWDGTFHSAKPFTFRLVAADGLDVGDLVELVRVYRNGDLMAAWNRSSDTPRRNEVVFEGNPLRTGFWAATLPPHRSAMDLRILPRGNAVANELALRVRNDRRLFRERADNVLQAGVDEWLPKKSPARQSLDCLKKRVIDAREQVLQIVRGAAAVTKQAGCDLPLALQHGAPLSEAYSQVKNQTTGELERLKQEAELDLDQARARLQAELPAQAVAALEGGAQALVGAASAALQAELGRAAVGGPASALVELFRRRQRSGGANAEELRRLYDSFADLLRDVDAQVALALHSVDESRALALELLDQVRSVGRSQERQAQIFNALAESLRTQGDVFEARRDNPPLLAGEQKLAMEYSDHWQLFGLAPWNGVPIHLDGGAHADLSAAVAVPLIDLVGLRLQWGKTRFSDARLAVGLGYTSTKVDKGETKVDETAALLHASLGLGGFKLGVGMLTIDPGPKARDQYRFIVGADLLKLITGSNVEVF